MTVVLEDIGAFFAAGTPIVRRREGVPDLDSLPDRPAGTLRAYVDITDDPTLDDYVLDEQVRLHLPAVDIHEGDDVVVDGDVRKVLQARRINDGAEMHVWLGRPFQ